MLAKRMHQSQVHWCPACHTASGNRSGTAVVCSPWLRGCKMSALAKHKQVHHSSHGSALIRILTSLLPCNMRMYVYTRHSPRQQHHGCVAPPRTQGSHTLGGTGSV